MSISFQIVYWRDIPAQIKVRSGAQRVNRQLSPRFQEAIDAAAMRGNATSTEDYLADWRSSDWQLSEMDPQKLADSLVAEIEAEYTPARLKKLVVSQGYED
jgi:hypothetical protein